MDIISRWDAASRNLTRYFTGAPCKHGHVAERYVTTTGCIKCLQPDYINDGAISAARANARRAASFKRENALERTKLIKVLIHLMDLGDVLHFTYDLTKSVSPDLTFDDVKTRWKPKDRGQFVSLYRLRVFPEHEDMVRFFADNILAGRQLPLKTLTESEVKKINEPVVLRFPTDDPWK